jgi:hypothetical protein
VNISFSGTGDSGAFKVDEGEVVKVSLELEGYVGNPVTIFVSTEDDTASGDTSRLAW